MKAVLDGVQRWRHELSNCLHSCIGVALTRHGIDALVVLGSRWQFYYRPGDLRREEYFWPCPPGVSLANTLMPYHPISSRWHQPADAAQGWQQVRERILAGEPALVAVDNFWLPFRPAYQDVHSNHLVAVYGFDDEADLVWINDGVPPAFDGPMAGKHLDASRDSDNPIVHDRDLFFTANPIGNKWLSIDLDPDAPAPPDLATMLRTNVRDFLDPEPVDGYVGLGGIEAFLRDAADRLAIGEAIAEETFVVAGTAVASAALHASALRALASQHDNPLLAEVALAVDRVAHHWTAIRILVNTIEQSEVDRLRYRTDQLMADCGRALAEVSRVADALAQEGQQTCRPRFTASS